MHRLIFPRKKVGVILLLSIFFSFLIGWLYPVIVNERSSNKFIISLLDPIYISFYDFIQQDFLNSIGSMVLPLGFLVALVMLLEQSLFFGAKIISWEWDSLLMALYKSYIFILAIDSGFYLTLYTLKRDKLRLKDEISLIIDRSSILIAFILIFNLIWWFVL